MTVWGQSQLCEAVGSQLAPQYGHTRFLVWPLSHIRPSDTVLSYYCHQGMCTPCVGCVSMHGLYAGSQGGATRGHLYSNPTGADLHWPTGWLMSWLTDALEKPNQHLKWV